jgi:ABC-2 type transport system permease protein
MAKTWLIFRHELRRAIGRASFIVLTLTVPILALLGIGVFKLATTFTEPPPAKLVSIGYVDEVGRFGAYPETASSGLVPYAARGAATQALLAGDISEYVVIPADFTTSGRIERYVVEGNLTTPFATERAVWRSVTSNLLADRLDPQATNLIINPLRFDAIRLDEGGAIAGEQSRIGSNLANAIIPSVFSLLMALALMFGALNLIHGLAEEKESRLIEVLFSSVSVRQLLNGKVLALGTVGLLQVLVWLISAPLLLNLASSTFGGILGAVQIPPNFIALGLIYFVLGYLLFAVFSIGVGAISSSTREAGQLSMFYTLGVFVPLWLTGLLLNFPDNAAWVVLTIFPLTAPIQTMMRLGTSDIPLWQIVVNVGVLGLSILVGLYLVTKIFRATMLMHGAKPGIREVVRSLKNA